LTCLRSRQPSWARPSVAFCLGYGLGCDGRRRVMETVTADDVIEVATEARDKWFKWFWDGEQVNGEAYHAMAIAMERLDIAMIAQKKGSNGNRSADSADRPQSQLL